MTDPNAKSSHDLTDVRKRARRHILDHGDKARNGSALDTPAEFAHLVSDALKGARGSQNRLATRLLPILRAASLAKLRAYGVPLQRARQLANDVANDVYVELLKDDARVLRAWCVPSARHDPHAYFRTIARRRAIDAYRRDRRNVNCDVDDLAHEHAAPPTVETSVMVRECLHRAIGRQRDAETAQHLIYDALIADARQTDLACDLGVSADAIYQRTSRFRREFTSIWNQE